MVLRIAVMIVVGLGTALWLWVTWIALLINSSHLGEGIAFAFAAIATLFFLIFTVPAFVLALKNKALWAALVLAVVSLSSMMLFL